MHILFECKKTIPYNSYYMSFIRKSHSLNPIKHNIYMVIVYWCLTSHLYVCRKTYVNVSMTARAIYYQTKYIYTHIYTEAIKFSPIYTMFNSEVPFNDSMKTFVRKNERMDQIKAFGKFPWCAWNNQYSATLFLALLHTF